MKTTWRRCKLWEEKNASILSVRPHYNVLVNRFRQQLIHINSLASTRFFLVAFSCKCILRTSVLILSNVSKHWQKEYGFYFKRSSAENELMNFTNKTFGKDPGDNFTLICHVASLKLSFVDTWSSSFHVNLGNKLIVTVKERLSLLSFCLSFFPVFSLTCHTRISSTIC